MVLEIFVDDANITKSLQEEQILTKKLGPIYSRNDMTITQDMTQRIIGHNIFWLNKRQVGMIIDSYYQFYISEININYSLSNSIGKLLMDYVGYNSNYQTNHICIEPWSVESIHSH